MEEHAQENNYYNLLISSTFSKERQNEREAYLPYIKSTALCDLYFLKGYF